VPPIDDTLELQQKQGSHDDRMMDDHLLLDLMQGEIL